MKLITIENPGILKLNTVENSAILKATSPSGVIVTRRKVCVEASTITFKNGKNLQKICEKTTNHAEICDK